MPGRPRAAGATGRAHGPATPSPLRDLGRAQVCAVMCAEAVRWRCHRRIIADHLLPGGDEVFHILGPGRIERASMNPAAIQEPDGVLA